MNTVTEKQFYTYFHTRNDTGAVFYVGKGRGRRAHDLKNRNRHWRNVVAKCGHSVHIAAQWPTEAEAFEHEKFLILCFKDLGGSLCNITNGGDGVSGLKHSVETKAKLRAASLGFTHTDEARAKISASSKGRKPSPTAMINMKQASIARTGVYRHSEETLEKMRLARIGRTLSDAHKAKIGAASTGRRQSEATREKIRKANTGLIKTAETKAKIGLTGLGRRHTDEAKAKISAASIAAAKRKREAHAS